MGTCEKQISYFMGSNTPVGFISRFSQLVDPRIISTAYVLKAGPGTGKSSLMRRFADFFEQKGYEVHRIYCSSDIQSLDAVFVPKLAVAILDGTPPHVIEPAYPGAVEQVVSLFDSFDIDKLKAHREEIIACFKENKALHAKATLFISAAGSLLGDNLRTAQEYVNREKLSRFCEKTAAAEFGRKSAAKPGAEYDVFFSAITAQGVTFHGDTLHRFCKRAYLFEDRYGCVGGEILRSLRDSAVRAGHAVICGFCPTAPFEKMEQLVVPELQLGFFVANKFHTPEFSDQKVVHDRRFLDEQRLKEHRAKLRFNRRAAEELLKEASGFIADAKVNHDKLESYYTAAVNFEKTDEILEKLLDAYR